MSSIRCSSAPLFTSPFAFFEDTKTEKELMEEMASLWSDHQESSDELKLKIYYTALELEAVRAKANEEMNKNTESVKQLLHILKLVCHERDEARDQIQKLLNKNMHSINNSMISDCYMIDQLHQQHLQNPFIKPTNANSSIAESNSLSDHAYNHCSPVTSPEFSNFNINTSYASIMLENMIKGKTLPQKGNLLKAVMEAGPLLQTLFATNPPRFNVNGGHNQISMMAQQSQQLFEMSSSSFSQMIGAGGSILCFNDINSSNCQGRMVGSCPMASNFGPVEKRQRFR